MCKTEVFTDKFIAESGEIWQLGHLEPKPIYKRILDQITKSYQYGKMRRQVNQDYIKCLAEMPPAESDIFRRLDKAMQRDNKKTIANVICRLLHIPPPYPRPIISEEARAVSLASSQEFIDRIRKLAREHEKRSRDEHADEQYASPKVNF